MNKILLLIFLPFFLPVYGCLYHQVDPLEGRLEIAADTVIFAVIGDYGDNNNHEKQVADMVNSWHPDLIITTGDNNYDYGLAKTIKDNIGQYYGDYIYNPDAPADQQAHGKANSNTLNRFFPCPGNHDYFNISGLSPYLNYFSLPGNEQYYDFVWGPVHFFSLNSGRSGNFDTASEQYHWFMSNIALSKSPWKIAYFHHPPISASNHGNHPDWQLAFRDLGFTAVFSGHDHVFERIQKKGQNDFSWIVNGVGGRQTLYACNSNPLDSAIYNTVCYNCCYGAIKVEVSRHRFKLSFFSVDDPTNAIDEWVVEK